MVGYERLGDKPGEGLMTSGLGHVTADGMAMKGRLIGMEHGAIKARVIGMGHGSGDRDGTWLG